MIHYSISRALLKLWLRKQFHYVFLVIRIYVFPYFFIILQSETSCFALFLNLELKFGSSFKSPSGRVVERVG